MQLHSQNRAEVEPPEGKKANIRPDLMENSEAKEQKTSVNSQTTASSAAAVKINLPTHKNTLGMTQHEREK